MNVTKITKHTNNATTKSLVVTGPFLTGRVPMCNVDANTCKLYGFDYDISHPRGPVGDDWCLANNKASCIKPLSCILYIILNTSTYWLASWVSLQWRHNERSVVSNHRRRACLLNCLFRRRSRKTSKLRVTGLCKGNPPLTGGFPSQSASNAENVPFDDVIIISFLY